MPTANGFTYLLRLSEAAALLGLSPGPARRWLVAKGVPMVDYGPGRGLGPRWPRDAIVEAIQASLVYPASAPPKRRKASVRPIMGRSRKELLDELAGPAHRQ